jgi:hypothetical protein
MTLTELAKIDAGVSPGLTFFNLAPGTYCAQAGSGAFIYHYQIGRVGVAVGDAAGQILAGACS